jgi:GDP-4-dehydro-6-deoxy-D-mannose reductase
VLGTLHLLEGIAAAEQKPRLVHCSSSEVYGNVPKELHPITEPQQVSMGFPAVNPYAATKVMQETLINTYRLIHGLDVVMTRAFGYINPRRFDLVATSLAFQIVEYESRRRVEVTHGDLRPVRSFCDARDVAAAYWLAATKCKPGVYNIGSEVPCSIGELLERLQRHSTTAIRSNTRQVETLARPTDIFYCVPDTTRFRNTTGWQPRYSLDESLGWLMAETRKRVKGET